MADKPKRWRKKPVVIEAWLNADDTGPLPDWLAQGPELGRQPGGAILIGTLEGVMRADLGDYVIRGVKGEVYPCKPDIFAATYESADAVPVSDGGDTDGAVDAAARVLAPDDWNDPHARNYWRDRVRDVIAALDAYRGRVGPTGDVEKRARKAAEEALRADQVEGYTHCDDLANAAIDAYLAVLASGAGSDTEPVSTQNREEFVRSLSPLLRNCLLSQSVADSCATTATDLAHAVYEHLLRAGTGAEDQTP